MKYIQLLATDYCKENNLDISHWEHAKQDFIAGFNTAMYNNILFKLVAFKYQLPSKQYWYFVIDKWGCFGTEYLNYPPDYPKNNFNHDWEYWLTKYYDPNE